MAEKRAYQFSGLEKHTEAEVRLLNRAQAYLAETEQMQKVFKAIGEALLMFDVYDNPEVELSLLVKPAGDVSKPQYFRFSQQSVHLGRSNESHVSLKSPLVSKKHAQISRRGVEYFVKDLNSNNGTFLNQVKLNTGGEVLLRNDDVIRIEPFEIVVGLPAEVVKRPLRFSLFSVRVRRESLGAGQIYTFFQVLPAAKTAVMVLESQVARWIIQKIVTGQKESPLIPWTEIESGLMEYLAAKLLASANPLLQESRLLLQTVEKDETAFQSWLSNQGEVVEMSFEAHTEIGMVYSFLYLPESLLAESRAGDSATVYLSRAGWLRKLRYEFSVNLGISHLSADQISLLEAGDILLLDKSDVSMAEGMPAGKVEIHSSRLRRGVIGCSIHCENQENIKLTVESLYEEGLKPMTDASKKTEGAQPSGEGILSSVEIPVLVELARLNYSLEELSQIKVGQIIEVKKPQPELVDLSVDGKVIANGKLVDVEGKMGVRILKIAK